MMSNRNPPPKQATTTTTHQATKDTAEYDVKHPGRYRCGNRHRQYCYCSAKLFFVAAVLSLLEEPRIQAFQFPNFSGLSRPLAKPWRPSDASDMVEIEKEVLASALAKLDRQRAAQLLMDDDDDDATSMVTPSSSSLSPSSMDPAMYTATTASPWKVSLAAASAVSTFVLLTTNASMVVAGIVFVVVFVAALGDPLEEDNATGAVARTVGRMTIQSVESSKPKLKAIAKAAISNQEEIAVLKQQITQLRKEKEALELWKQQRLMVEASFSKYSLDELKEIARENRLPVGGPKMQLMMRLVQNDINLD
jgi:hypothetical protein